MIQEKLLLNGPLSARQVRNITPQKISWRRQPTCVLWPWTAQESNQRPSHRVPRVVRWRADCSEPPSEMAGEQGNRTLLSKVAQGHSGFEDRGSHQAAILSLSGPPRVGRTAPGARGPEPRGRDSRPWRLSPWHAQTRSCADRDAHDNPSSSMPPARIEPLLVHAPAGASDR